MAKTLYFIHGMWGGPWCWDNYLEFFGSRGYRCVAATLPYHDMEPRGTPDPRLGTTGLQDYAARLEAEIRQLGDRPVLVGHSMGGLLAQMLAARGLAEAVVLLASAAPSGIFSIRPSVVRCFWSTHMNWGFWRKPVRPTFGEAAYGLLHRMPAGQRRAIYDRFVFESGRTVIEIGYWFLDRRDASRIDATAVTCPMLVVAPTEDRVSRLSVARRIAEKYTAVATFREAEGHAHWLMGEPGWEVVAAEIDEWLKRLPSAAAPAG